MTRIIDNRTLVDQTIRIYDSFYNLTLTVSTSSYDIVYSFFLGTSASPTIAQNFTAFLFRIAQEINVDVLVLLEQLKTQTKNKIQVNKTIAFYLNSLKSKTSLYSVSMIPRPNVPVARNIVL